MPLSPLSRISKAVAEIVLTTLIIVAALPLILVIGLVILVTTGLPIFYGDMRAGKNGRPFRCWKFRTLPHDADANAEPCNRFARYLRATHLNELPQLWNILRGEMSLIGPRPVLAADYAALVSKDSRWRFIMSVKPGMSGLNQIARYVPENMQWIQTLPECNNRVRQRVELDSYYARHRHTALDLRISLYTAFYLFRNLFRPPSASGSESPTGYD